MRCRVRTRLHSTHRVAFACDFSADACTAKTPAAGAETVRPTNDSQARDIVAWTSLILDLILDSKNPTKKRKAVVEGAAECASPSVCLKRFDEDHHQAAFVRLPSGFRTHPGGMSSSSWRSDIKTDGGCPSPGLTQAFAPLGSFATCLGRSDRTLQIRLEHILMRRGA